MKQKHDPYLILPKKEPKTVLGVQKWHREIMSLTLFLEFKQRALKSALDAVNSEIREYSTHVNMPPYEKPARMALEQLNKLKSELTEQLEVVKRSIRIAHDTNESIIGSMVKSAIGEQNMRKLEPEKADPRTNLLHGVKGWMTEVAAADKLIQDGYCAFVTFGTLFDPKGIDVVAVSKPRRRVAYKLPVTKRKRKRKVKRPSN